jgi:signal transduction histidine kinase
MSAGDVLVVDDSPQSREILTALLESRGHSVRVAGEGAEALSLAQARAPDLVMLDINMPGLSGFEVCRQLRERWPASQMPVMFLSAAHELAEKVRAFQLGGVDYVTKPFQLDEVAARVEAHLKLCRLQKQSEERAAELEVLNARLNRQEVERRRFLSAVVHDLKNPLTPVLKNSEWLLEQPTTEPEVTEVLRDVHLAANHMHRMVLSLLDVARGDAQALAPRKEPVALRTWLEESLTLARLHVRSQPGRLLASADDATVQLDPLLMARVLQNLLDNALKYAPRGTAVRVVGRSIDGTLELSVEDSGRGIPHEARARAFDAWARLEDGRSEPDPHERVSHGLGLAFCKQAVEAHGGTIAIEDVTPHGTRFVVTLPRG